MRKQRRDEKTEQRHRQHEQQQRQRIVGRAQVGAYAQAGVKPDLLRQVANQRKASQAHGKQHDDTLDDVLVLEVAELMGQHSVYFGRAELLEQRVVKNHALGCAKAGEISVGMGRTLAAVHHEQAFGCKTAALHQRRHAGFQAFVFERLELVEHRRDHGRVQHQNQQVKTHPDCPGPQPPQAAGAAHQPQDERDDGQSDHDAHQRGFQQIAKPELQAHLVEAKALFNAEGAVQREGQIERAADQAKAGHQRQLLCQRPPVCQPGAGQRLVQRIQPAQQRPAQQHRRTEGQLQQAEARFGEGVVGRLLVRGQRNGGRKSGGHCIAVTRHMADLARAQVQLEQHAQHQSG